LSISKTSSEIRNLFQECNKAFTPSAGWALSLGILCERQKKLSNLSDNTEHSALSAIHCGNSFTGVATVTRQLNPGESSWHQTAFD